MSVRLSSKERAAIYRRIVVRDGEHCQSCLCPQRTIWRRQGTCTSSTYGEWPHCIVYPTSSLEVEHAVALRDGGTNQIDNLRLLCIDCHKRKTGQEATARAARTAL